MVKDSAKNIKDLVFSCITTLGTGIVSYLAFGRGNTVSGMIGGVLFVAFCGAFLYATYRFMSKKTRSFHKEP